MDLDPAPKIKSKYKDEFGSFESFEEILFKSPGKIWIPDLELQKKKWPWDSDVFFNASSTFLSGLVLLVLRTIYETFGHLAELGQLKKQYPFSPLMTLKISLSGKKGVNI